MRGPPATVARSLANTSRGLTIACLLLVVGTLIGQTTQGIISGRVVDSGTAKPLAGATVTYNARVGEIGGTTTTDSRGYFTLPLLSPGTYRLLVKKDDYQPQQIEQVELPVAGWLDFAFLLRPVSDVWEAGHFRSVVFPSSDAVLTFYGPDVDTSRSGLFEAADAARMTLDTSLSTVIDQQIISNLPLNGRDVYTLLATQPGVTSDTATARGLGLAVGGQRPSASNFLLDGLENDNYLVTGPLHIMAPESVDEYRISTANYSAEYGRTSGVIANAITRSPGTSWHGRVYDYLKTGLLDANGFQENANGIARAPLTETEPGVLVGGPVLARRLFVSASFELGRHRSEQDPESITLPTAAFLPLTAPNSTARKLLEQYQPPPINAANAPLAELIVRPPVAENRLLSTSRLDYLRGGGSQRFLLRAVTSRDNQPDFGWTPYEDFVTPLIQNTLGTGGAWVWTPNPRMTNESRAGVTVDEMHFNRPHPDVPTLTAADGTILPGSPEPYSYRNHGRNVELEENQLWMLGRHVFKFGGGVLARLITGYVTPGQSGYFGFRSGLDFAQDMPITFYIARLREDPSANIVPDYNRSYRYTQYSAFAEDSFKASPRFGVNLGFRYENFGAPANVGDAKDAEVQLAAANTLGQGIAGGRIVYPGAGNEQIYHADNHGLAVRAGFAYDPRGRAQTVIRGGYGIFYDQPFDNLWMTLQINNLVLAAPVGNQSLPFLLPVSHETAALTLEPIPNFPQLTLLQPGMRDAYAQNAFIGVQQRIATNFTAQMNAVGSLGRELLTTDLLNRPLSVPVSSNLSNPFGKFQPSWPMIAYRGNQGSSDHYGLEIVARYQRPQLQFQGSYTLSHTIDNQSDPLAGEFFNFNFTNPGTQPSATFTRQFDSSADRAASDFDQRHNLVMYGVWEPPALFGENKRAALFRSWTFGGLAAFRSGFPYNPIATSAFNGSGAYYLNNRPNLILPSEEFLNVSAPGGVQILNPAAFAAPPPGTLGNIGRNALRGPGFYSADLSLSRTFGWRRLGEAGQVTLRADAFNLLNHVNLNNPETSLNASLPTAFGAALYGRQGYDPGFPGLSPLNETARQIQMMLRVEF
jgi:Carboxypeptidase regulatory-like domain/TonB dependent receptor